MLDCGHNGDANWRPSKHYAHQDIDRLFLLNLDQDHLSDLPAVLRRTRVSALQINPSITQSRLCQMKPQGLTHELDEAYVQLPTYADDISSYTHFDWDGARINVFWNVYGRPFTDTNNLSLAVFITYGEFCILFAGDLETPGWRQLFVRPAFRTLLARVNILVASHHGRRNGQCEEVMKTMRPDVVVFSDDSIQYGTQETDAWYRKYATGLTDHSTPACARNPDNMRYVLTTRRDGFLGIEGYSNGGICIRTSRQSAPRVERTGATLLTGLQPTTPYANQLMGGFENTGINSAKAMLRHDEQNQGLAGLGSYLMRNGGRY